MDNLVSFCFRTVHHNEYSTIRLLIVKSIIGFACELNAFPRP